MATQTYDSGWEYDFKAALALGQSKSYYSLVPNRVTYGHGVPQITRGQLPKPAPAPTAEQLHRHAAKYGPEGVQEIADLYGIDMKVKKETNLPSKHRRTTQNLKSKVLDLHARGLLTEAIADTLNVHDDRVRKIIRDSS